MREVNLESQEPEELNVTKEIIDELMGGRSSKVGTECDQHSSERAAENGSAFNSFDSRQNRTQIYRRQANKHEMDPE